MSFQKFFWVIITLHLFSRCRVEENEPNLSGTSGKQPPSYSNVEDVMPPPPNLIARFKTLDDWLEKICETENPETTIVKFHFGLFEAPGNYTIFLVGVGSPDDHIDFEPSNMYFPLPKSEFKDRTREQVLGRITSLIKNFTTPETFKTSFLTKADSITTDFSGTIWLNEVPHREENYP